MRPSSFIQAITFASFFTFSMTTLGSGVPDCSDDECTREGDFVLQRVLLPLIQLGKLDDQGAVERFIFSDQSQLNDKKVNERGEVIWRWPRREFNQVSFLQSKQLSVEIAISLICIRRVDVEKVFKEQWLVGQTPGQWFIKDKQSRPDMQHNGTMSFSEGRPYRFTFSFVPSGCARSMSIYSE